MSTAPTQGLTFADCNHDGFLDLLTTGVNAADPRLVSINNGGSSFSTQNGPFGAGNDGVSRADLNNDGLIDFIFEQQSSAEVYIQDTQDCSSFQLITLPSNSGAESPVPIDIDLDGDLDIFFPGDDFAYYENLGGNPPTFETRTNFPGANAINRPPECGTCIDLNGDTAPDCIYTEDPATNNTRTATFSGDPANPGQFRAIGNGFYGLPSGLNPYENSGFIWGDCNNDGLIDVYIHEGDGGQPTGLWINTGTQLMGPNPPRNEEPNDCSGGDWGDIDQDGDLDLFLSTEIGGLIFLNDGNCGLTLDNTLTPFPQSAAGLADFDNDGDLDVVSGAGEYWTNTANGQNFLKVQVQGTGVNSPMTPFGAQIRLFALDGTLLGYREVVSTNSLFQPASIHTFGVSDPENTRFNLEVFFPTSRRTITYAKCRPRGATTTVGATSLNMFTAVEGPEDLISCTVPPELNITPGEIVVIGSTIGNSIQVTHDDLGDSEMLAVSMVVSEGTITVTNPPPGLQGLTRPVHTQTSGSSAAFVGTLADVNAAISSISFSTFPVELTLLVDDSPTGEGDVNSAQVSVTVDSNESDNSLLVIVAVAVPIGFCCLLLILALLIGGFLFLRSRDDETENTFQSQNTLYTFDTPPPKVSALGSSAPDSSFSSSAPTGAWAVNQNNLTLRGAFSKGVFGEVFAGSANLNGLLVEITAEKCAAMDPINAEFSTEANKVIGLRPHPNVLATYGFSIDSRDLYVLQDAVEYNYKDYISSQNISGSDVLYIGTQIASGVNFLHENKILHGSLCTRAVWVTQDLNTIKVSTFGISQCNRSLRAGGCQKFFAPEIFAGEGMTFKSDVWAFGLILLETFSKKEPFPSLEVKDLPSAFKTGLKALPPPQMPLPLQDIFKKCTKLHSNQRPLFLEVISILSELRL